MDWRLNEIGPRLRQRFGRPVRKLCLRLGATCPNRDGTRGSGGCIFCAEPKVAAPPAPLSTQILEGLSSKRTIRRKQNGQLGIRQLRRQETVYLAYLQDHSPTYGLNTDELKELLRLLSAEPQIVGLIIGTRPDCLPDKLLKILASATTRLDILIELGLQTANEQTLSLVRRQHTVAEFSDAVRRLHAQGLRAGAHVILGLPKPRPDGRLTREDKSDGRVTAALLTELKIEAVKFHHCYVPEGTALAKLYRAGLYQPPTLTEYCELLLDFVAHLPATVEIHRLLGETDAHLLLAPAYTADKQSSLTAIRQAFVTANCWQGQALGQKLAKSEEKPKIEM